MASNSGMGVPSGVGGIVRYDAEYQSRFMIAPTTVLAYVVALVAFVFLLRVFVPGGL